MNKNRRDRTTSIISQIEAIKTEIEDNEYYDEQTQAAALSPLKAQVSDLREEEQDYLDHMPESFQNGNKGEATQNAIDELDNADSYIDQAIDDLAEDEVDVGTVLGNLEDAIIALERASE